MTDRKKICKIRVGSHLYGTNRPESDQDFYGVFLPRTTFLASRTRRRK
jgi:predicted nucleotidyltransferase